MTRLSAVLIGVICLSCSLAARGETAPRYEVDPFWPKELPHEWVLGQIRGVTVDSNDHIWVLNDGVPGDNAAAAKTPPQAECCVPAPSVIELDQAGNVVSSWGKRGFVPGWPLAPRGIYADKKGNLWIGGVGSPWNGEPGSPKPTDKQSWDRHILKFSREGKLLLQIGQPSNAPLNNQDTTLLGPSGAVVVDDAADEIYVADGFANRRVVVFDSNTGAFKRGWGAYGIALSEIDNAEPAPFPATRDPSTPPSKQFRGLTDIEIANDGDVYVADQMNARIQVFTKQGKFVKEFSVAPHVLGFEATWSMALSRDPRQRYLFITDGESGFIRVLDRGSGAELGKLGHKGRNAGQFSNLGWVALDSKGTLYTGEVHFTRSWDGKTATLTGKPQTPGGRLQRFILKR
jgi:DNA-binding beta-propeller fold protein YncE